MSQYQEKTSGFSCSNYRANSKHTVKNVVIGARFYTVIVIRSSGDYELDVNSVNSI